MPNYFERLGDILNSTPTRTIANYLMWRVVLTTSEMLTYELREIQIRFSMRNFGGFGISKDFRHFKFSFAGEQERWKQCIKLTSKK